MFHSLKIGGDDLNLIKSKYREISYIKNQDLTINEFKQTPLHKACMSRKTTLEIIKFLVEEKNLDLNQQDCINYSPFLYACQFMDDPIIFKYLLKQNPNLFLERSENSLTLICKLTENIQILSCILLHMIDNKIEYDFKIDDSNENPINIAKKNKHISKVKKKKNHKKKKINFNKKKNVEIKFNSFEVYSGNFVDGKGIIITYKKTVVGLEELKLKVVKNFIVSHVKLEKKLDREGLSQGTMNEEGREYFVKFKNEREFSR